jgi:DNA-binding transcriptional ArsR family regulator
MARYDARAELASLEAVLAALAHASRRQILLVLQFRGGAMSAGDIAGRFHCRWPTISRHLRLLEEAGLIRHERSGRVRTYHLVPDRLDVVRRRLGWFDPGARAGAAAVDRPAGAGERRSAKRRRRKGD